VASFYKIFVKLLFI